MCPALLLLFAAAQASANTQIAIITPLGTIVIELFDDETPIAVTNFLDRIAVGEYESSFVHRSTPKFVIQGGLYTFSGGEAQEIPPSDPHPAEIGISNRRGTIAMAHLQDDINSATSSWFINVVDNPDLDTQDDGYTVFGRVLFGMGVVEQINELERWNAGTPFFELPLIAYPGNEIPIDETHLVFTNVIQWVDLMFFGDFEEHL